MRVNVMSRAAAIRYCHQPHTEESIIISISDELTDYPSAPFRSSQNGVKDILRLRFDDVDTDPSAMTEDDGKKIREFLDRNRSISSVIVHCDAGQSRSAGVAAAILKAKTGSDMQIFKNHAYTPNILCYRITLENLMEEKL